MLLKTACFGILTWIMLEYFIHRYLGHETKLLYPFYDEHQTHHRVKDYFAPIWKKVVVSVLVVGLMTFLGSWLVNSRTALIYSSFFMSTYLSYEFVHFSIHAWGPKTGYGRWIRKHHYAHHYINGAKNFSVMIPFIDYFFGTKIRTNTKEPVRVPKKFAMDWLCDEKGEIKPKYQADYRL